MKAEAVSVGVALVCASVLASQPVQAVQQEAVKEKPATLDELLQRVKSGWKTREAEIKKRETAFVTAKQDQERLLKDALATVDREEQRSTDLELLFETNETRLAELEETLRERLGTMGELFGVIRQVAGDTRGHLDTSLISAQLPGRQGGLAELAESKGLPSIAQLEHLWFTLQQEMTESGKVVRFPATVVKPDGHEEKRQVVRIGVFNAVAGGKYLTYDPEIGKLKELQRQPPGRYLGTLANLERAEEGLVRVAVDPSRGSFLSLLVLTPSFFERLKFGGLIGGVIIGLGILALLAALARLAYLFWVNLSVRAQLRDSSPRKDSPLGRVLSVHSDNPGLDTATLELKLDEAVLREQAQLERYLWAIKVVSVVAPLLGLLGTVTGMIRTFQAIMLVGTGDPKAMASGISEALVTTMLGLFVAIPLVLLHSWLRSMSRSVIDVLGEQSVGMVASVAEQERGRASAA